MYCGIYAGLLAGMSAIEWPYSYATQSIRPVSVGTQLLLEAGMTSRLQ